MLKSHRLFCILVVIFGAFLRLEGALAASQVYEVTSLAEVVDEIDEDTLVIFDIDNTLMAPQGNVGSDAWFGHVWALAKRVLPADQHYRTALRHWVEAQSEIVLHLVEQESIAFIHTLHQRGIRTMGLTARDETLAELTIRQLEKLGIPLGGLPLHDGPLHLLRVDFPEQSVDALYRDGVAFGGDCDKGVLLRSLFSKLGFVPKKIVYIDDKVKHVLALQRACAALGIAYAGYRYGALDDKIASFEGQAGTHLAGLDDLPAALAALRQLDEALFAAALDSASAARRATP